MKSNNERIGVFMPTWVGDAVMSTPMLRALRSGFEDATIVGVMRPVISDLMAGSIYFDECVKFEKRRRPGIATRWGLIAELRKAKLSSLILLTNSLWTAAVAKLAGVPNIVGYSRDCRGWLLTDGIDARNRGGTKAKPSSTIEYYLRIAHHVGCEAADLGVQLFVSPLERQLGDALWARVGFCAERPTVVINSNSATEQTRLWPEAKIKQLAARLTSDFGTQILLHCGPAERAVADRMAKEIASPLVASMGMADDLPIGLTKAVMDKASVVVSTDSGPRHIAVAMNRPVVSLFGPTSPDGTPTFNVPEVKLGAQLSCRPCYAKTCPLKHNDCMKKIEVDSVYHAVATALGGIAAEAGTRFLVPNRELHELSMPLQQGNRRAG